MHALMREHSLAEGVGYIAPEGRVQRVKWENVQFKAFVGQRSHVAREERHRATGELVRENRKAHEGLACLLIGRPCTAWQTLHSPRISRQWSATTSFDSVTSVGAPDVFRAQALKNSSDLTPCPKVLVPTGQRIVRVQERPLALKVIAKRQGVVIRQDR